MSTSHPSVHKLTSDAEFDLMTEQVLVSGLHEIGPAEVMARSAAKVEGLYQDHLVQPAALASCQDRLDRTLSVKQERTSFEPATMEVSSLPEIDQTVEFALDSFYPCQHKALPGDAAVEAAIIVIAHPDSEQLGTRYRLPPCGSLELGRATFAGVNLANVLSVSRLHARLEHRGQQVEIEDLASTNGTFVNDRKLTGRQVLHSGDRFQVGAVHFKFLHEADPEHAYYEAIYHLVMCDGLTQAYNKRKFDEEMQREFARARRHHRPLSLILFDLDHFKRVNDTHGHLCGDFVLQQIARLTREHLRPEQVFARVGGEEFVILSPEMQLHEARILAEKLRRRFCQEEYRYPEKSLRITCSFGVVELLVSMQDPKDLYDAADRAMYRAKHQGRNRVGAQAEAD